MERGFEEWDEYGVLIIEGRKRQESPEVKIELILKRVQDIEFGKKVVTLFLHVHLHYNQVHFPSHHRFFTLYSLLYLLQIHLILFFAHHHFTFPNLRYPIVIIVTQNHSNLITIFLSIIINIFYPYFYSINHFLLLLLIIILFNYQL